MKIREFIIDDYDAVYALWRGSEGMGLNDIDDSREGIARYLRRNPHTSFVAEAEDIIIGVIMCGHDGRRGYIYHTCVASEHRRNGIGARLAEAALDALKAEGISKAALVVFGQNKEGNDFWEHIGFRNTQEITWLSMLLNFSIFRLVPDSN